MSQITLTIKTEEGVARPEEMRTTLQRLITAGLLPSTGLKMTFVVATDDDAEDLADLLDVTLEDRPWVIDAEIEIKSKRGVKRRVTERPKPDPIPTPMDIYLAEMA